MLSNDFDYYEPSLSITSAALKIGYLRSNSTAEGLDPIFATTGNHLKNVCKVAREAKRYEVCCFNLFVFYKVYMSQYVW